jgi:hypothetical protein
MQVPLKYPILFVAALLFLSSTAEGAMTEADKIRALLDALGASNLIFVRNGVEYTAEKARAHLEMKLARAGGRVRTAENFITFLAAKSSTTGKPYHVKLPDGSKIESAVWLRRKLKEIESGGR